MRQEANIIGLLKIIQKLQCQPSGLEHYAQVLIKAKEKFLF